MPDLHQNDLQILARREKILPVCVNDRKDMDSLRCYACADSGNCETSYDALIHNRDKGGNLNRNCSAPNQHYCMIESIKKEDKDVSFIRDCSDGHTFSYNDIPRLKTVMPNNQSTCAYYQAYVICISVCRTDFCNGPQEGISRAGGMNNAWALTLTLLMCWIIHWCGLFDHAVHRGSDE
ncbi:uncharacterized protein LOC132548681 [Ylistrum balloti]|uniref:uncharacterized protein LOC132548681 n=1 Tax=Ylistrum balloti TaxID=509963 RepID=UPI002905EC89|nr:uncharacterized protein LOC132548681 [Ylistrum balloti]